VRSTLALLSLCAALAAPLRASAADTASPAIAVTGTGEVRATPDLARISAGVVTEAPRAADAVAANSAAMAKVTASLDHAGIERKHVQTRRFDVSPLYAERMNRPHEKPQITGYRVSNSVEVEVHGVDRVGPVLDALVGAGANELGGIQFDVADPAPLLDAARKQAFADARRKAELYAREAGVALGCVQRVEERAAGGGPVPVMARMEAAAAPPVAPGQLGLGVAVDVIWSLAP
jgi:hypothetical protein